MCFCKCYSPLMYTILNSKTVVVSLIIYPEHKSDAENFIRLVSKFPHEIFHLSYDSVIYFIICTNVQWKGILLVRFWTSWKLLPKKTDVSNSMCTVYSEVCFGLNYDMIVYINYSLCSLPMVDNISHETKVNIIFLSNHIVHLLVMYIMKLL